MKPLFTACLDAPILFAPKKFIAVPRVIVLSAACLFMASGVARADYSTNFEAPDFTPGPLAGQSGWSEYPAPSSVVQVGTGLARSGTQALTIIPALAAGLDGAYYTDNTPDPLVVQSADIYLYSSSTQSEWQFAALGSGLIGFAGGIGIRADDSIVLITAGIPVLAATFTRNVWNHVDLTFDYTAQTYSVDLNGSQIASNVAFCGDNSVCAGANVPFHANGFFAVLGGASVNDLGVLDNYSVTAVPEADNWAMLLAGLSLVGWQIRRRDMLGSGAAQV